MVLLETNLTHVNIIKLKECLIPVLKQPGAGPGCCDRRRLVAGCRPGSRYPPHLAFTLVNSSIFSVEILLKAKLCHNMNNAFMLPLIQSVPVLSQHPVNNSKTLQPFILFTPFAPTYCRWDATLLPQRFMGRAVIWTPLWKIGLKSVRSNFGLWHQGLLLSQVVMHPCPPDKQWKASLQTLQFAYFHFDCRPTEQITKEGKRVRTIVKQSNWQSITCG